MKTLPNEILHNIFIQLSFQQRSECTLVCRYWANCLYKHSLLYDIDIKSDQKFNNFINMLQTLPNLASQVEIVDLNIGCTFDKRSLLNMLPNLRIFRYSNYFSNAPPEQHCSRSFQLVNPNSNLELIKDDIECELTKHLLMFGSCTRLRHLDLSLWYIHNPRMEIFIHLKSAPALKELILRHCIIGIDDLEIIHKDVPTLKFLYLSRITLFIDKLPLDIIPATTVKIFKADIDTVKDVRDHLNWYKYLAKKYTHLTYFDCFDRKMNGLDPSQKINVYRDGIFPIYKTTEEPIPQFDVMDFPTELNPFNTLDEFDLRVSRFNLANNETRPTFKQLAESHQSKYVEVIKMDNTIITSPTLLRHFTSLTSINIDTNGRSRWDVHLGDYFNAFPDTLTSFSAHFCDATITELPSHPNNIQHLDLKCTTLYPRLGEAISNHFPKLINLYLQGRVTDQLSLNLPSHHLNDLDIQVNHYRGRSHLFSITTATNPEPQHYISKSKRKHIGYAILGTLYERAVINVNCGSVRVLRCDELKVLEG